MAAISALEKSGNARFFCDAFIPGTLLKVFGTHCRRHYSSTFPITYSLTAHRIPISFAGASEVLGNGRNARFLAF